MNLKYLFPHGSTEFFSINDPAQDTKPEPSFLHESLAKKKRKNSDPKRCLIRIKSFRQRLLDPDNLCPKFFIDALKISRAIQDDREKDIILQIGQEKVKTKAEERTVIDLIYP